MKTVYKQHRLDHIKEILVCHLQWIAIVFNLLLSHRYSSLWKILQVGWPNTDPQSSLPL